jgi:NAD(P)-dependent dehydrogenase (short-subunit alcohol dehydrogenase family)
MAILNHGGLVTLVDMSGVAIEAFAKTQDPGRVLTLTGSVADAAFVEKGVAEPAAKFGAIYGLVNNAGIVRAVNATISIGKLTIDGGLCSKANTRNPPSISLKGFA